MSSLPLRMLEIQAVLDVGTASGHSLGTLRIALPQLFVCSTKQSLAAMPRAAPASRVWATPFHFANNGFEAVCEFGILYHVPEPHVVVGEMLRCEKGRARFRP